jgi:CelD/BcsL family acetyltransferase involved in cellulose biosynthesis
MTAAATTQAPLPKTEAQPSGALEIELLEGREAFAALERDWNAALSQGPRDEPMLRHEWIRAWIENFAPGLPLRIFVARAGKVLAAAVPLVERLERSADTCFVAMKTWATPCNDHSQRGGILLGARGVEALPAVFARIAAEPGWDRLRLRELPEGAAEWRLKDIAESLGHPCGVWVSLRSPYLALPQPQPQRRAVGPVPDPQGFAEIEARLDSKFRANLRRRRRRLAETGELRYRVLDGKDAAVLDCALADLYAIEASGWKGRGGTAIAQRPELVGFYTQIARDAAKRGALALGLLEHGKKRIAAHLSIVHAGRAFLLKLGYDEALREHSPGQQLVADALRDACARGLVEFDFLGPDMSWKQDWEPALRTHSWLTIFRPTTVGRLVHGARFTVWPAARALLRRASGRKEA